VSSLTDHRKRREERMKHFPEEKTCHGIRQTPVKAACKPLSVKNKSRVCLSAVKY
jgi:hypothetical protein